MYQLMMQTTLEYIVCKGIHLQVNDRGSLEMEKLVQFSGGSKNVPFERIHQEQNFSF